MLSAFGVEHGEISKGRLLPPKRLTGAQKRTMGTNPGAKTRPQRLKSTLNRVGEADISLKGIGRAAGSATKGTGNFLERHPGLTGTALVGGGTAGGYRYLSQKEPKR